MKDSDMLRSEVARHLRAEGAPADAEAVTAVIEGVREDAVALLQTYAHSLVRCTKTDCRCFIAALVWNSLATELREAA